MQGIKRNARPHAMLNPLRLPPARFHDVPSLGRIVAPWPEVPSAVGKGTNTLERLRTERLGGTFWRPQAAGHGPVPHLVSLLSDNPSGLELIRRLTERFGAQSVLVIAGEAVTSVLPVEAGVHILRNVEPHSLLCRTGHVWALDVDDWAMLGLVHGCTVTVLNGAVETRLHPSDLEHWLRNGIVWRSPFTQDRLDLEDAIEVLSDARRFWEQTRGIGVCVGMAWWKRARMAQFLDGPFPPPVFRRTAKAAVRAACARNGEIAVWTSRVPPGLRRQAHRAGNGVRQVEDGFLRSVGLGSDLLPPSSIVIDGRGIYFDPSRPSDLEHLLATTEFTPSLRDRARRLTKTLVERNISKYGADAAAGPAFQAAPGQTVILVPGQVGDDLSIRLGCCDVRDNLSLLQTVRARNPQAYVIFRPHPDVDAGHRAGAIPDRQALLHADKVLRGGAMTALIRQVDEVHTMTSLAGFEALLRGKKTVTYGQPFYAGWSLTRDMAPPVSRRGRMLLLEDLVAATLILYPCYLDPVTRLPCGPEILIQRLSQSELWQPGLVIRLRRLQGRLRRRLSRLLMLLKRDMP
ncbi:capsular polysaccharide export protein, LipB/KpsS family [Gluconobacter morbifer]|uniref:Capsule polysaccharide export protein n=1 Tax=Gluconobacter morbifer G707 TaxID=1088869 RepID=G6XFB9_9PROT|nr:beta-3-deoxy-D-manno-oct-2-ulosonic acid transferase [Gluconobacter morbifer]EHH68877.1 hypothetical protein GMO_01840 [Gluconobacter morbifer G707]